MTRRRYRRHNQSLALSAAIAALALFGAPPLVPAFARAADPSADQIIAESLTDDPIAVAENNRLDRNFDVDADADFDLDANPTSAGTPAHLPDVVAALGDAVKNLAVDIPRLANLTEVLSDQSARVQATSERISGLDAQIHATENQARKAFHAKVRALAHAFYAALDEQTQPKRDRLATLKVDLRKAVEALDGNVTEADGVSVKVRRLKAVQESSMAKIQLHMARRNLVLLEVGEMTFTYRNPSASPAQIKKRRRLEAMWTHSKAPVTVPERRLLTRRGRAQFLGDVRVDAAHANSFLEAGRRSTTHHGPVSLAVRKRYLLGAVGKFVGEVASDICESCLETAERGVEGTKELGREAAALAERGVEGTKELGREGVEFTRETVEVPLEWAASAAREVERLANEAIEYARGVASNAWDALSKAAAGLIGMAKEAYDFLGKLENAFTSAVSGLGDFIKSCLNNLSQVPQKLIEFAESAGMNIPAWAKNALKMIKSVVSGGWQFIQASMECYAAFTDDPRGTAAGCAEKVLLLLDTAGVPLPDWSARIVTFLRSTSGDGNGDGSFQDVWRFLQDLLKTCSDGTASNCVEKLLPIAGEFLPLPSWAGGIVEGLRAVETFVASDDGQKAIGMVKDGWQKLVVPCVSNITRCTHNFGILQIADEAGLDLPPVLHHVAGALSKIDSDPLSAVQKVLDFAIQLFKTCTEDKLSACAGQFLTVADGVGFELPRWAHGVVTALRALERNDILKGGRRERMLVDGDALVQVVVDGWEQLVVPCMADFQFCVHNFGILQIAVNSTLDIPPVLISAAGALQKVNKNPLSAINQLLQLVTEIFKTCTEDELSKCVGKMIIAADMFLPVPKWAHGIADALRYIENRTARDGVERLEPTEPTKSEPTNKTEATKTEPTNIEQMGNAFARGWSELIVPCLEDFEFCIENFGILQIAVNSTLDIPPVVMSVGKMLNRFDDDVGDAVSKLSSFVIDVVKTCTSSVKISECAGKLLLMAKNAGFELPSWAGGVVEGLRAVETFVASDDGQKAIGMVKDGWQKLVVPCVSNITRCTHNFGILQIADEAGLELPPVLHHVAGALSKIDSDPLSAVKKVLDFTVEVFKECANVQVDILNIRNDIQLAGCAEKLFSVAMKVGFPLPEWGKGIVTSLKAAEDVLNSKGGNDYRLVIMHLFREIVEPCLAMMAAEKNESKSSPEEKFSELMIFFGNFVRKVSKDKSLNDSRGTWLDILEKIVRIGTKISDVATSDKGYRELKEDETSSLFGMGTTDKLLWWCLGKRCTGGRFCAAAGNKDQCENTFTDGYCAASETNVTDTFECYTYAEKNTCNSGVGCEWKDTAKKCSWESDFSDCLNSIAEVLCDAVNPVTCSSGHFLHGGGGCSWHVISQIANDRETMDQETRYTLVEDHEDDVKEWFEPSSYEKDYYGRKLFPTWNWPGENLNQKCSKQDDCRFKDDDGRVFRYDCITPCKDSWVSQTNTTEVYIGPNSQRQWEHHDWWGKTSAKKNTFKPYKIVDVPGVLSCSSGTIRPNGRSKHRFMVHVDIASGEVNVSRSDTGRDEDDAGGWTQEIKIDCATDESIKKNNCSDPDWDDGREYGTCGKWTPVLGPWDVRRTATKVCWPKSPDGKEVQIQYETIVDEQLRVKKSIESMALTVENGTLQCFTEMDFKQCFYNVGWQKGQRISCKDPNIPKKDRDDLDDKTDEIYSLSLDNLVRHDSKVVNWPFVNTDKICHVKNHSAANETYANWIHGLCKQMETLEEGRVTIQRTDSKKYTVTHQAPEIGNGPWLRRNQGLKKCTPCLPGSFSAPELHPDGTCKTLRVSDLVNEGMCRFLGSNKTGTACGIRDPEKCMHKMVKCEKCAAGRYQDQYGQPDCVDCPAGWASGICSGCKTKNTTYTKEYFFNEYGKVEYDRCYPCPPGMYGRPMKNVLSNSYNEYSGDYSDPDKLYAEYPTYAQTRWEAEFNDVVTRLKKATSIKYGMCVQCPSGYFSAGHASQNCTACAVGKYNDKTYAVSCDDCDSGKYNDVEGSTRCANCPAGRFGDGGTCTDCPAGWYTSHKATSREACIRCGYGFYSNNTGSHSCVSCDIHGFPAESNTTLEEGSNSSAQCVCPKGTFDLSLVVDECTAGDSLKESNDGKTRERCSTVIAPSRKCLEEIARSYSNNTDTNLRVQTICGSEEEGLPASCSQKNTTVETLHVNKGWWRANKASLYFLDCSKRNLHRKNFEKDCPGSVDLVISNHSSPRRSLQSSNQSYSGNRTRSDGDPLCSDVTTGPLCITCKDGYTRQGGECKPCSDARPTLLYSIMVLLFAIVFIVQLLMTRKAYNVEAEKRKTAVAADMTSQVKPKRGSSVSDKDGQILLAGNLASAGKVMPNSKRAILKNMKGSTGPVLKHFQVVSSFTTTFWNMSWPFSFKELTGLLAICNLDIFGLVQGLDSPDVCSLTLPFLDLFRVHMAMPIIVLCAAFLVNLILSPCYGGRMGKNARYNTLWEFVNTVVFFLYPGMAQRIFQVFRCTPSTYFPETSMFLTNDPSVECLSPAHMSGLWLAVVCMFIYIIGIPAVMFFVLFSNRKAIKDTSSVKHASIKKRFGTLFRMYEPKYYYWEIVETVMKGFMTGALVVILPGTTAQFFVGIGVALFHMIAVFKTNPYVRDADDWLHFVCSAALVASLFCGLYIFTETNSTFNVAMIEKQDEMLRSADVILVSLVILVVVSYVIALVLAIPDCRKFFCCGKFEGVNGPAKEKSQRHAGVHPKHVRARGDALVVTSNVQVAPSSHEDRPQRLLSHVQTIQREYQAGQDLLEKNHKKQKRATQLRLNARLLIRQSNILQKVPVFSGIAKENISKIVEGMTYKVYEPGATLCRQGDVADRFHILVAGMCYVTVAQPGHSIKSDASMEKKGPKPLSLAMGAEGKPPREIRVGTLKAMQFFGESACAEYDGKPHLRNATVRASKDASVSTMSLSRGKFTTLVNNGILNNDLLHILHQEEDARVQANTAMLSSSS